MKSWPQVKADAVIADGTYSISVSLWHATNDAESMGNGALDQSGKLVVQNGEATLYLHLKNFSYYGLTGNLMQLDLLTDISYNQNNYPSSYQLLNSTVVSNYATVDEYNAADSTDVNCAGKLYPKVVSIPTTVNTEYMWSHVYVPIMGSLGFGDQLCRIKVDYSSLTEMSEEQIQLWNEYETSDTTQTEDDTDNSTDDGTDDGSSTVTIDKSALKTKLDEANSYASQTDVYTAVTLTKLTSAIATAQTVYDNASTTQTIVNAQITALQAAINDLVKISSENLDKDNLEDGKYNVYVALWHATSDQESMGNAALNHTSLLTVKNGVYTLDVSTHPITVGTITACLQSLQIEQTDESYSYASVTANNNTLDGEKMPSVFSFTLPSKEEYISVKIDPQVAVMGTDPLPARLKISWDTLTLVSADTTVEENTETTTGGLNSPAVNLKDSTTGIKIKAAKNILVSGVSMKVSEISSGTDYTTIQSLLSTVGTDFVAYDISLYNTEGSVVEPNGMVSVYIPIPDDYDSDSIAVYRVTDSAKTKLTTTIEDGYAVFQTNSFSMFALVDTSSLTQSTLPTKTTGTLTKKSTSSSSSTQNSNLTGANGSSVQSNQNLEEEESSTPVTVQIQQDGNSMQPNQIITLVLVVVAISGSMVIMLFIIGFVLMDSLLKRRK